MYLSEVGESPGKHYATGDTLGAPLESLKYVSIVLCIGNKGYVGPTLSSNVVQGICFLIWTSRILTKPMKVFEDKSL